MKFRKFAETLLGSKVKIKILRILLREETVTSERELAKIIGVSHGAVNRIMKEFHEMNLVEPLRIGNVMAWQINKESFAYAQISGMKAVFSPLEYLIANVKSLQHLRAVKKAVIYGSVAEGRELPNSDIDLFILVKKEEDKKTVMPRLNDLTTTCIRRFGNKLSPSIFTEKEIKSKRNRGIMNIISKGIAVFDRED